MEHSASWNSLAVIARAPPSLPPSIRMVAFGDGVAAQQGATELSLPYPRMWTVRAFWNFREQLAF